VRFKQRIRFPLFECLFRRISVLRGASRRGGAVLRGASRRGGGGGMLYGSRALRRTYTLFYPHPGKGAENVYIVLPSPGETMC
jgi:hypothetical protein